MTGFPTGPAEGYSGIPAVRSFPTIILSLLSILILASCSPPDEGLPLVDRDIFGIGVLWSDWLSAAEIPDQYESDPREYDRAQMAAIKAAGGTAIHGSFDWCNIEPVRGSYDWSRSDEWVADAEEFGLRVYAYIGNTPDWALPIGWSPGTGWRTPPDEAYAADFEAYCSAVAERYAGRVERFFFWNEPNGCSWVNDGCSNGNSYTLYTAWLKRAYPALKAGNPSAVVAAGCIDYGTHVPNGSDYIEGMYAAGAQGYFDAIDIHPYAADGLHWEALEATRGVMVAHGDGNKQIWVSEYGWSDSTAPGTADKIAAVLETLAGEEYEYVEYARYLVLCDLPGGTSFGLMERDLTPRDAFAAFKDVRSRYILSPRLQ